MKCNPNKSSETFSIVDQIRLNQTQRQQKIKSKKKMKKPHKKWANKRQNIFPIENGIFYFRRIEKLILKIRGRRAQSEIQLRSFYEKQSAYWIHLLRLFFFSVSSYCYFQCHEWMDLTVHRRYPWIHTELLLFVLILLSNIEWIFTNIKPINRKNEFLLIYWHFLFIFIPLENSETVTQFSFYCNDTFLFCSSTFSSFMKRCIQLHRKKNKLKNSFS